VAGAEKRLVLDVSEYNALIGALRQDLKGQPDTALRPSNGDHVVPDLPKTVVAVRQADGTYQKVAAVELADIGKKGGYPAPVYDAYLKLNALTTAPGSTPYTFSRIRYGFQCAPPNVPVQPWPAGLPQPTPSQVCQQSHLADGDVAAVARKVCATPWAPDTPNPPPAAYRTGTVAVECFWRYALPDETS
jgi:hypothetical protein